MSGKEDEKKKLTKLLEETKQRRVEDFDSGLLQTIFEDITGSPDYVHNRWCSLLIRLAARIKNLDDTSPILKDIEEFFDDATLPSITTSVDDYKQTKGRVIEVKNGDKPPFTCTAEIYPSIEKSLREEHYLELTNKVRWLVAEAISVLDNKELAWHGEDMLTEVEVDVKTEADKKEVESDG